MGIQVSTAEYVGGSIRGSKNSRIDSDTLNPKVLDHVAAKTLSLILTRGTSLSTIDTSYSGKVQASGDPFPSSCHRLRTDGPSTRQYP